MTEVKIIACNTNRFSLKYKFIIFSKVKEQMNLENSNYNRQIIYNGIDRMNNE